MKTPFLLAALGGALLFMSNARADEYRDLYADTWAASDALGRELPMGGDVRPPQDDKFVGIFYFVWQGHHGTKTVYDMTKITAANPDDPQWGPQGAFHWWAEPEVGYYQATDPWVARRNLRLLSAAGVDCLFVDVTNAFTYPDEMKVLFETARQMRAQGNPTPQIAFLLNSNMVGTAQKLWDAYYKDGKYQELWFRWDGKPLILANKDDKTKEGAPIPAEIQEFFSWRRSWFETYSKGWFGDGKGKWAWRDRTPQKPGLSPDGAVEQIAVGVASHPIGENIGRSYANKTRVKLDKYDMTATYDQGIQFQEQWDRALEVDPPLVFITGWNEWVAQRQGAIEGQLEGQKGQVNLAGRPMKKIGDPFFVDVYNAEFSRDADMMKGGYTDNYYLQMAANIRRYKGARPVPIAGKAQTIPIDGDFALWREVWPEFRDSIGDTMHRDFDGWGDNHYPNTTGRNDIVAAKVTRDADNVTFYAKTNAPLTPRTDARWMMLFINSDQNSQTGWNGYDLRVNAQGGTDDLASVERFIEGAWVKQLPAKMAFAGAELELSLPRNLLARDAATPLAFDFKWVDNADPDDIADWFLSGDCAPERRFNYRYKTE